MRSSIIKICLIVVFAAMEVHAEGCTQAGDSTLTGGSQRETRTERLLRICNSLIPSQIVIQNAGNMGLLSAGVGWNYGRHGQWETHLLIGFVPSYHSKSAKTTFTAKENYIPWRKTLSRQWMFEPLTGSFYLNAIFGHEFWSHQPSRYPNNYYPFSTKIRMNLSVGERITYQWPDEKKRWVRSLTAFYEIGSCDLYLIDYIPNRQVSLKDVLGLSLGIKLQIR